MLGRSWPAVSRRALFPGSFDPFTNGHLELVRRALRLFDEVVVGVAVNPDKRTPLFTPEERVAMIEEVLADEPRASVTAYVGLTVDEARRLGAQALIKGLRLPSDFESELQQALMNRQLAPELETVFLAAGPTEIFLASSILKDVASWGQDVDRFVPPAVARRLRERRR